MSSFETPPPIKTVTMPRLPDDVSDGESLALGSAKPGEKETLFNDLADRVAYMCDQYFNSTLGSRDLCVLFSMTIGLSVPGLPSHTDEPFTSLKTYHKDVKPDAQTLRNEVVRLTQFTSKPKFSGY